MRWADDLIYWNFPLRAFAVLYCIVFLYVLLLTVLVPFWRHKQ
jgi:hypothetical protein